MVAHFASLLKNKNMIYIEGNGPFQATSEVRRVAFLLLENFSMMAFTGAVDALVTANLMRPSTIYEVLVVGNDGDTVLSDLGIEISVDCQLSQLDEKQLDILILCGGLRVPPRTSAAIRSKLRVAGNAGVMLGGLWNGAYFLAEAGLLDGYECAYYPDGRALMMEEFPHVMISNRSFVLDRDRVSCAGASSSLNMMLEIVKNDCGEEFVSAIEEVLSCDKMAEVIDVSVCSIDRNPTLPEPLKISLQLMRNNIEEPLSIMEISECVGISRRQLERLFCHHVDASPSRYYLELRLTHARQLLQQTNKPIAEIAVATGFVSISHFRRCFHQLFDISAGRFRKVYQEDKNSA
ncbi:GlxA family transcriptional regulator [Billgrantia pellis]|uniref:GlxA family transcriptional regulator n=1 Tax=Billgrantia pellis TaxID=2606936 RepID=A0A7V7G3Z5_9GAMM|nr:GlxA family transcriptional regulator [Halomonas pellis]KAA0012895.1 GlxA family transcriptional regulator [Halomonas pellis]